MRVNYFTVCFNVDVNYTLILFLIISSKLLYTYLKFVYFMAISE